MKKLDLILNKISNLESNMDAVKSNVESVKSDMEAVKADITAAKITLENETNRNIKIVAEGRLDLSRKLNEAIKIASNIQAKQEIQDVYMNIHESKLRAL